MTNMSSSKNRSWMLTIPVEGNPQEEVEEKLKNYIYIGQQEKGRQTGYLHWQVYIENKTMIKFSTLKNKFPTAHLEVRHNSREACYEYCTKSDTAVSGTRICNGTINVVESKKPKVDVEMAVDLMKRGSSYEDVIVEYPSLAHYTKYLKEVYGIIQKRRFGRSERPVEAFYIYGEPGAGKTKYIYNKYGYDDVFVVSNWTHPFDSYENEKVLVLDEFYDSLPFEYLLKILEGYPLELDARYGSKWACYTKVFIVSNRELSDQYGHMVYKEPERMNSLYRRIKHNYDMINRTLVEDDIWLNSQVPLEKR
jgi:hypothetical protein